MNKRKKVVAEHALSLFVEKGIAQTSIQDILNRAGISKGTFYNYFSSKHECVSEIIEQARYDATLMRSEFMIGKDPKDYAVLSEQITILSTLNRARGLDVVFEEMLHSGDRELKKVVLKYRVYEIEWLAVRFQEVFNIVLHEQAFEAAVIFYGMMQHLSFVSKMVQQNTIHINTITNACLIYMQDIVRVMLTESTNILDGQCLDVFVSSIRNVEVTVAEAIEQLQQFCELPDKTKSQQEITDAIVAEVQREDIRAVVIDALLRVFTKEFDGSPYLNEAKEISSVLWYLVKQNKFNKSTP